MADVIQETHATECRLLVCGGRGFKAVGDAHRMLDALHALRPIALLIHGAAVGADSIAANWAKTHGIPTQAFPAQWEKHGKGAGPIRNKQMLLEGKPTAVLAFVGGRGTANMVAQAKAAGIVVIEAPAA